MSKDIVLFAGHDVVGLQIVNGLIPVLQKDGFNPIIYNTQSAPNRTPKSPPLEDYKFYDTTLLEEVIIPFFQSKNDQQPVQTYEQLATYRGIEHHTISNVDNMRFFQQIDGAICIRFKQIFNCDTIKNINDHSKFFWNLHGGLLPQYRGALAAAWAKIHKETEQGWSLHEIAADGTIDSGDLICETKIKTSNNDPVIHSSYAYLIPPSIAMIHQSILNHDKITPLPLSKGDENHYYSFPSQDLIDKSGLTYCTPESGLNYYMSLFGSDKNKNELKALLTEEINKYELSKNNNSQPPLKLAI